MNKKIINYFKISNYVIVVFWVLILFIVSKSDPASRIGSFFESFLLFTSVLFLCIVLNSNKMFSRSFLISYEIGSKKMQKYQIESVKSNYYIVFCAAFLCVSIITSYLLMKYSTALYALLVSLFTVFCFIMLIYHVRKKSEILEKIKHYDVKKQEYILYYFGIPALTLWSFFTYASRHMSIDSLLISIIILGICTLYSIVVGIKKLLKIKKE
jgi:hypothetical protein